VFKTIDADTTSKGDREMSVCEMQAEYEKRNIALQNAYTDSLLAVWRVMKDRGDTSQEPKRKTVPKAGGIGALYCAFITNKLHIGNPLEPKRAEAAELAMFVRRRGGQDTTKRDTTKRDSTKRDTTKQQPDTAKKPLDTAKTGAKPLVKSDSVMVMVNGILKKVLRTQIPAGAYIPETAAVHQSATPSGAAPAGQPIVPPGIRLSPATPGAGAVPAGRTSPVPPNPSTHIATPPPGVASGA